MLPLPRAILGATCLALAGCAPLSSTSRSPATPRVAADARLAALAAWTTTNAFPAEEYVISKFRQHDVVLLGEVHRQAQDLELVQALMPRLYAAGVFTFGTEFARRVDQPLIDSLLALPAYDERLARLILFRDMVDWGFQEYVDVFRAAWGVNRARPAGARPFRVLGINNAPDWSQMRTPADADDPARRALVWHGETEQDWARLILDSVVAKGDKILVHEGAHHAFSEFLQPVVDQGRLLGMESQRMGNFLFRRLGKRVITVRLHSPWQTRAGYGSEWIAPAEGVIDSVIALLPRDRRRIGFDLTNTPFGALRDSSSVYAVGHDGFTLERMADGWIVTAPLAEIRGVRPIPDFVNEGNVLEARQRAAYASLKTDSLEAINRSVANDAALAARRARLVAERLGLASGTQAP